MHNFSWILIHFHIGNGQKTVNTHFYNHYVCQPVLDETGEFHISSFSARMPLLMATSACGFGRRYFPKLCYLCHLPLHHLCTVATKIVYDTLNHFNIKL